MAVPKEENENNETHDKEQTDDKGKEPELEPKEEVWLSYFFFVKRKLILSFSKYDSENSVFSLIQ